MIQTGHFHIQSGTDTGLVTDENARAADTADGAGGNKVDNRAVPVEDTDLFTNIFNEVHEEHQEGHMTKETDQLRAKVALAIPKQESAESPAAT